MGGGGASLGGGVQEPVLTSDSQYPGLGRQKLVLQIVTGEIAVVIHSRIDESLLPDMIGT